ncbi:MAG: efflux RND transporter periplasmic adaptor subunit [Pseudomonadota bacterium]
MASRRGLTISIVAILGLGAVGFYWWAGQRPAQQQQQQRQGRNFQSDGPVPVIAALTKRADVPVYLDGVGTARALNTVTVRPQVDGKLISVNYVEGQDVKRGFVLAKVDPVTYQAQYDQAVAKKAQDEATLANARIDLDRYEKLSVTNSIARQQYDTQKATVAQLEAQVRLDQAAIDNAKAILEYTDVIAPLDGRTGIRLVDQGNIVRASDTTGIVIITQLQPLSILFTLPQQQLSDVVQAKARGEVPVDAFGADNKTVIDRGTLGPIDNQVDQTTGTIKLKAEFPNAKFQLWPGQFVNVRVQINTLTQVVVAPTSAVQRGPNGTFVFVVQQDSTVAVRPVTITQQDEAQAVIATGLQPDERVVTTGFARLTAGAKVTVTSAETQPANANEPVAEQPRRERRQGGPDRRERRSEANPGVVR